MHFELQYDCKERRDIVDRLEGLDDRERALVLDLSFWRMDRFMDLPKAEETPIERLMHIALAEMADRFGSDYLAHCVVEPQYPIEIDGQPYRVDFLVTVLPEKGSRVRVVVECDGHDFHEKTKEQATRDKFRDRAIQSLGWKVLHFTGSEIWKSPRVCAEEVLRIIKGEAGLE